MLTDIQKQTIIDTLSAFDPKGISVFGSYALGKETAESDIDLLVEFGKTPGLEYFGLIDTLEKKLGIGVDLTTPNSLNIHARPYIENTVQVIYQKEDA